MTEHQSEVIESFLNGAMIALRYLEIQSGADIGNIYSHRNKDGTRDYRNELQQIQDRISEVLRISRAA